MCFRWQSQFIEPCLIRFHHLVTAYDGWKSHAESYAENGKKNQVKILISSKLSSLVMWVKGGGIWKSDLNVQIWKMNRQACNIKSQLNKTWPKYVVIWLCDGCNLFLQSDHLEFCSFHEKLMYHFECRLGSTVALL